MGAVKYAEPGARRVATADPELLALLDHRDDVIVGSNVGLMSAWYRGWDEAADVAAREVPEQLDEDALWITVRVKASPEGVVVVRDEIEGTEPEPFGTVNTSDGEQLGRLILALAQVEAAYSGRDPLSHAKAAVTWLANHEFGRR